MVFEFLVDSISPEGFVLGRNGDRDTASLAVTGDGLELLRRLYSVAGERPEYLFLIAGDRQDA